MIKLITSIIKLVLYCIFYMVLSIYSIFRLICWPILGRPVKTVEKVKYVNHVGLDVKPQSFVNKLWSRLHDDDKLSIKSSREVRTAFRLGVIMALESGGVDPKLVELVAECMELK